MSQANWKDIDTLEYKRYPNGRYISINVMIWVKGIGPIQAFGSKYKEDDSPEYNVVGTWGIECENDFDNNDVTHWDYLPEGPYSLKENDHEQDRASE